MQLQHKLWKEIHVDEQALATISLLGHITSEQEDYIREEMETATYHAGLVLMANKSM